MRFITDKSRNSIVFWWKVMKMGQGVEEGFSVAVAGNRKFS